MNIGFVANESKKKLIQNFCIAYRAILAKHELFATGTTGRLIEEVTNLTVHKYLAGTLGGEQQMGAQIENNDIDLVIFMRDPSPDFRYDRRTYPCPAVRQSQYSAGYQSGHRRTSD